MRLIYLQQLRGWLMRLFGIFHRKQLEQEFGEELESHLAMHIEDNLHAGMSPEEARRQALIKLGGVTQTKELYREQRGLPMLETLLHDLRFGMRMLRKNPGFSLVAILTLALSIGANTAIFSLVDAVLLKLLPVRRPEQLVVLKKAGPRGASMNFSYPLFAGLRDDNQVFADAFATFGVSRAVMRVSGSATGQPENVACERVSGGYFTTLGVATLLGRTFTAEEDKTLGSEPQAVISYGFWQRRFAADPSILGKTISLDDRLCTIIGVTPPEFFGVEVGNAPDVWLPLVQVTRPASLNDPGGNWLSVIARLKPGITEQQASAGGTRIFQAALVERVGLVSDPTARREFLAQTIALEQASHGLSQLRQQFSQPLRILTVTVGLLLLIACANLASLLLARAEARQKEIAVRLALGASRLRLIGQLLTESVLLACLGSGAGLLFAVRGRNLLLTFIPQGSVPLALGAVLNLRVLAFTAAAALASGILFGLAPALRATRVNLTPALKDTAQTMTGGRHLRWGNALVVTQVALSLVLLIGAGLVVRSLQSLQTMDAGFERQNVLTFGLELPRGYKEEQTLDFSKRLLTRIKTLPGAQAASFSFPGPFRSGRYNREFSVEGYTPQPGENNVVDCLRVMPEFFEALGITLRQGRSFTTEDNTGAPKVAVINESMARYFFPQQNPLGKRLGYAGEDARSASSFEIIGVVKEAHYRGLREAAPRIVYLPALQLTNPGVGAFIVRMSSEPAQMIVALRREAQAIDRNVSLREVKTLAERV